MDTITGDSPLSTLKQDEFGLEQLANGVARMLTSLAPSRGFTVGIAGPWGSGKSTFANFVAEKLSESGNHIVIRFEPWLIGEKNALIASFLGQLASEIDRISPKQWKWWQIKRWKAIWRNSRLSKRIRTYGSFFSALSGPVAGAATMDPTGSVALAATGLKTAGLFARLFGVDEPIEKLKERISAGLLALREQRPELRFTTIIDDTDRLDADEAIEILRLVRKTADFPLVSYVVCFDSDILTKQISTALKIDGREYLERIFQDVIQMPPQEPFALRRYLKRLLKQSFASEMSAQDNGTQYRMEMLFDRWSGRLLNTPRDVVRLHQAVQLSWPHVPTGADFCDFVWLQLLKLKHYEFYDWVRNYVQNIGSYRDRGRPGDSEATNQGKQLFDLLKKLDWHDRIFLSGLDDILPGVKSSLMDNGSESIAVFKFDASELDDYERTRRLGSPTHWRGYFAFAFPSYAVSDDELVAVRSAAASDPVELERILRAALDRPHERTGHFLDVLLDRLSDGAGLTGDESAGLAQAFARIMDDVERATKWSQLEGRNDIWERSRFIFRKYPPKDFTSVLKTGQSLSWLAYILRDQGFALGKPDGHRPNPENAWLKLETFDEAVQGLCKRFEKVGMHDVFELPSPMGALLCWIQLGDADDVKKRFQNATKTNTDFLTALNAMRSWANSSSQGVYHPLHSEVVKYFAEPDQILSRLRHLSTQSRPKHRPAAQELLAAWVWEGRW